MSEKSSFDYIKDVAIKKERSKLDAIFPNTDPELMKLLKGFLEFNPYLRLSAKDALESKIFDFIRKSEFEKPSKNKIKLKINAPKAFDYDDFENSIYTIKDYKKILKHEIRLIKKMQLL